MFPDPFSDPPPSAITAATCQLKSSLCDGIREDAALTTTRPSQISKMRWIVSSQLGPLEPRRFCNSGQRNGFEMQAYWY